MWNPFKRKNKQARDLRNIIANDQTLRKYEQRGLIHWQRKDKLLLIEESLAQLLLSLGKEKVIVFMHNIAMWQNFRLIQQAYEDRAITIEADAVRKVRKERPDLQLTDADIQRIRQNARATMPEIDTDTLDTIKEFDIFIIRATAISETEATQSNGQLIAVGHFADGQLEMAMYDDIKNNLNKDEQ